MDTLDFSQALQTATKAAQQARGVLLHYFGRLKKVQEKTSAGLVSEADVESERVIAAELKRGFPQIQIVGEEDSFLRQSQGQNQAVPETAWVVDPLDGTTNYVHKFPVFCISIGLQWKGELVVGVIDVPLMDRTYTAVKGRGAFVNGERLAVSQTDQIKDALLATGFVPDNRSVLVEQLQIFSNLVFEARGIRRAGAAAYDLCMVAEGIFDAFWEKNLKPWDAAAGALLVREAGGVVWTFEGQPYGLRNDTLMAGNPMIAPILCERIQAAAIPTPTAAPPTRA
jgi:myo-inositol-1(or 4)-monophosphatase